METGPLLARHGITRVADITGLDTLGVPVWSAIRPAARSFAVSAGKGLDSRHAYLTAVMEAVETSCAEESERLCTAHSSIAEIVTAGCLTVPFERIGKVRCHPDPHRPRVWMEGREMSSGRVLLAPYETVGVDGRVGADWDRKAFAMTSAGSAAHPDPEAALTAALLEAVEADARALATACPASEARLARVPFERGTPADDLAMRVRARGVRPVLLDATSDIGYPVALCLLGEEPDASGTVPVHNHAGAACRANWNDAALAALLEAIQSRLTTIAGARDDVQAEDFARRVARPEPVRCEAPPPPDRPGVTPEDIAEALRRRNCGPPIVFDLAPTGGPACVSVLVPGLTVPGGRGCKRLRERMIADAFAAA